MRAFLTLDDIQCAGKTVLLRADLNLPVDKAGKFSDNTRLVRLKPTIADLQRQGAKIVVLSHFGRPDGKADTRYTLQPVAIALGTLLQQPVSFASDCAGAVASDAIRNLPAGGILVLENTRFHAGEEANDPAFTKQVAALGDLFVLDAFSVAHRAHATTTGLADFLPAIAGRQMQAELEALEIALEKPQRPVIAIVGGAKISTKLDLLNNLVTRVQLLVLGGGMANTFLAARGVQVGQSLVESSMLEQARIIDAKAAQHGCSIILPTDAVLAEELKPDVTTITASVNAIPPTQKIFDIGPVTIALIKTHLSGAKTVVWNGPLGVFEVPPFDQGTRAIAVAVGDLTKKGKVISVAGGGETVAALSAAGQANIFTYISAAGGAFLEWLEGKELPGVTALKAARVKYQQKLSA
jgi:phosphoglycerate kinase